MALSVASALEELEVGYTSLPTDLCPGIKFLSASPPKGQCLKKLKRIVLSQRGIASIGCRNQIAATLDRVLDLDLSHNGFEDWAVLGEILGALPQLKQLDLSFNPLKGRFDPQSVPSTNSLTELAINGVGVEMGTVQSILKALPQLKSLQMCYTPMASDDLNKENQPAVWSETLEELWLDDCQLESWSHCLALARHFPALQHLRLSENPLENITAECSQTGIRSADAMPNLKSLSLRSSALKDWESVEALSSLPQLEDLMLKNAPLFDEYSADTKLDLLVPRIPNLKILNGSVISTRFRENCERSFIRYYQLRDEKPQILQELIAVHGQLEQLVSVDFTPQEFARARLRCDEKNLNTTVRFRLHITVRKFLVALSNSTGVPMNRIRVLHVTPQYPHHTPSELRPSGQYLHTLRVEDGDEFHVFSKIVPSDVSHL